MPFKDYEMKKLHNINYRVCKSTLTDKDEIKIIIFICLSKPLESV